MYERPDDVETQGGILLPHQVVKEDEYQGKVGVGAQARSPRLRR